jgi:hypothetical protein
MRRRGLLDVPYWHSVFWYIPRTILSLVRIHHSRCNEPRTQALIGYYALELAKACWNAYILDSESVWLKRTKVSLEFSRRILEVVGGEEEDETAAGLVVIETLESLISQEL